MFGVTCTCLSLCLSAHSLSSVLQLLNIRLMHVFPSVLPLCLYLPPSDGQNEFSLLSSLLLDFGCPWQQRSVSSILLNVDIEHCVDDVY